MHSSFLLMESCNQDGLLDGGNDSVTSGEISSTLILNEVLSSLLLSIKVFSFSSKTSIGFVAVIKVRKSNLIRY